MKTKVTYLGITVKISNGKGTYTRSLCRPIEKVDLENTLKVFLQELGLDTIEEDEDIIVK